MCLAHQQRHAADDAQLRGDPAEQVVLRRALVQREQADDDARHDGGDRGVRAHDDGAGRTTVAVVGP